MICACSSTAKNGGPRCAGTRSARGPALARGPHKFRVIFVDTRTKPYKYETWQNWPNLAVLWQGTAPELELSGPGLTRRPIPEAWLRQEAP